MKRTLLNFILLLTLVASTRAAELPPKKITGKVIEKSTGKPLQGVKITALPGNFSVASDLNGKYSIALPAGSRQLSFAYIGFKKVVVDIRKSVINISMEDQNEHLSEIVVVGYGSAQKKKMMIGSVGNVSSMLAGRSLGIIPDTQNTSEESYTGKAENTFKSALKNPLSTFSIDVDAASYTNIRRFINNGSLPAAEAVRTEEMINYFDYDYPQPTGGEPVNIITEISNAPWNNSHKLVKIALQGKKISTEKLPPSNLVFLIDVSGSMDAPNKLPLLISSFKLLVEQLRPIDKVAIVVYAGNAGLVLPSTSGDQKTKIKDALNQLQAGGSTAGGAGINLAYKVAMDNFVKDGNNRVLLATDGDFNIGASSDEDMEKLIEAKRKSGVFLTTLGFGMGNYKDSKMETLADKGNGNYAYIDNISEARKVLINEFGGTLFTIAKDVKLQVEFNPAKAQAYRLIGYENRMLKSKDFNDDTKDAGEMGSGHTVTALYEVIPVGVKSSFSGSVDDLKYQDNPQPVKLNNSKELMTVKLRYKKPDGNSSKLISKAIIDELVPFNKTSDNFRFSASVAEFAMLLNQSSFRQASSFDHVIATAQKASGSDAEGYRAEFIKLVKSAKLLAKDLLSLEDKNLSNEKN